MRRESQSQCPLAKPLDQGGREKAGSKIPTVLTYSPAMGHGNKEADCKTIELLNTAYGKPIFSAMNEICERCERIVSIKREPKAPPGK